MKAKNHSCTLCPQKFSIKRDLIIHTLRSHKNSTKPPKVDSDDSKNDPIAKTLYAELRFPFKCTLCTIGFSREDHLKRHVEAVHERKNAFKCMKCDAKFENKDQLKKHIDSVHDEESNKPFKCKKCDTRFAQIDHLETHIDSDHGEKQPEENHIKINSENAKELAQSNSSKALNTSLESSTKANDISETTIENKNVLETGISHSKKNVSLYRHTVSDICVLVDPLTGKILPKQSSVAIEYMQKNHPQDSIQSLIDKKILVELCGNNVGTAASLFRNDKTVPKQVKTIENQNIAQSLTIQKDHGEKQAEEKHIKSDSENTKALTQLNSSKTPSKGQIKSE